MAPALGCQLQKQGHLLHTNTGEGPPLSRVILPEPASASWFRQWLLMPGWPATRVPFRITFSSAFPASWNASSEYRGWTATEPLPCKKFAYSVGKPADSLNSLVQDRLNYLSGIFRLWEANVHVWRARATPTWVGYSRALSAGGSLSLFPPQWLLSRQLFLPGWNSVLSCYSLHSQTQVTPCPKLLSSVSWKLVLSPPQWPSPQFLNLAPIVLLAALNRAPDLR